MQQQYWNTRQSLLKKLGNKEDECIILSDSLLDTRIVLFNSIYNTCLTLTKITDKYMDKVSILAREEISFGKFLKENGKCNISTKAGITLTTTGKGLIYCGQQRIILCNTLSRLTHEIDIFFTRGVHDCNNTVINVEKSRNKYRAALAWMKAASNELDPDSGKGLNKFRKAQSHVKDSKREFDRITLNTLQKIDLLAAARCNMFSHALINYQNSFLNFATRASEITETTAESLSKAENFQYDFNILKELSQNPPSNEEEPEAENVDRDRLLFFQDDYKDDKKVSENSNNKLENTLKTINDELLGETAQLINTAEDLLNSSTVSNENNLMDELSSLDLNFGKLENILPSQLMQDNAFWESNELQPTTTQYNAQPVATPSKSDNQPGKRKETKKDDMVAWFKLFAELDPLANPDSMPGTDKNQSHAA